MRWPVKQRDFSGKLNMLMIGFAGFFLLPALAFAKVNDDAGPEFNSGQWVWALFSLIIVVSLAYWATKFLAGKFGFSQARHIKVAESLFLGPNRHLYLLLVNGKTILVGSSEHGISLLKEFDDPNFYEELLKTAEANQAVPTGKFAELFGPVFNNINSKIPLDASLTNNRQKLIDGLEKIRSWKMRGRRD